MSKAHYFLSIRPTVGGRFLATLEHSQRDGWVDPAILGPYKSEKIARAKAEAFAARIGATIA